jgi:hypothetical protein
MDRKDLAWKAFFNIEKAVRHPTAHKRFAHCITTDGCSVSVHIAHAAASGDGDNGDNDGSAKSKKSRKAGANSRSHSKSKSKSKSKSTSKSTAPTAAPSAPALSDTKREQLALFAKANPLCVVGIDPGKRNLLYVTNQHAPDNNKEKEGTRLRYSFGQRLEESGKPWRDAKLAACKTERIFELENQLSQHNSHTSSLGKFQEYLATWC